MSSAARRHRGAEASSRILGLLSAAALLPGAAQALSLGEPVVESGYGQPLRVVVPVELGGEDELTDAGLVQARLLGSEHYELNGVAVPEIPPAELRARTEQVQGRTRVVLTSDRAVREPLLTLFVQVRLGPSQIVREVPVLLDVQETLVAAQASPPVAAFSAPASPAEVATVSEPARVAEAPAPPSEPVKRKKRRRDSEAGPTIRLPDVDPGSASALAANSAATTPAPARFRLDDRFDSYRQLLAAGQAPEPLPQLASAPEPESLPAPASDAPAALAAASVAVAAPRLAMPPPAASGGWWGYLFALLGGAGIGYLVRGQRLPMPDLAARWRQRARRGKVVPPAARDTQVAALAAPLPVELPMAPAPGAAVLRPEPVAEAVAAVSVREGYPNQELRERASQLARKVTSPSDRRKLELVKAYIDVDRSDSAEKLLSEIEQRHLSNSRPETLDFELH